MHNASFKPQNGTLHWASILPGLLLSIVIAWIGIESSKWIGREVLGFQKSPVSGIMMAIMGGTSRF
jgi:hypothetical protein